MIKMLLEEIDRHDLTHLIRSMRIDIEMLLLRLINLLRCRLKQILWLRSKRKSLQEELIRRLNLRSIDSNKIFWTMIRTSKPKGIQNRYEKRNEIDRRKKMICSLEIELLALCRESHENSFCLLDHWSMVWLLTWNKHGWRSIDDGWIGLETRDLIIKSTRLIK